VERLLLPAAERRGERARHGSGGGGGGGGEVREPVHLNLTSHQPAVILNITPYQLRTFNLTSYEV